MGAVANMAPKDLAAIVAQVPFVDVLNSMLDDTLPLTPLERLEWGNPIASEADYRSIASTSPYDKVAAKPYPAILAMAELTDSRVTFWEPAKWVLRLRDHSTSGSPVLFKVNMDAGHGGASRQIARLDETALIQTFVLRAVGEGGESGRCSRRAARFAGYRAWRPLPACGEPRAAHGFVLSRERPRHNAAPFSGQMQRAEVLARLMWSNDLSSRLYDKKQAVRQRFPLGIQAT